MARGEKLTKDNAKVKFEQRVNRAAAAIQAIGKCRRWEKDLGLQNQSVNKALEYLGTVVMDTKGGSGGGFRL